jgi:hypothetical protein
MTPLLKIRQNCSSQFQMNAINASIAALSVGGSMSLPRLPRLAALHVPDAGAPLRAIKRAAEIRSHRPVQHMGVSDGSSDTLRLALDTVLQPKFTHATKSRTKRIGCDPGHISKTRFH